MKEKIDVSVIVTNLAVDLHSDLLNWYCEKEVALHVAFKEADKLDHKGNFLWLEEQLILWLKNNESETVSRIITFGVWSF